MAVKTSWSSGDVLTAADLTDTFAAKLGTLSVNAQTGTAYTLTTSDPQKVVTMTNAAATTVTIPTNATAAIPVGSSVQIVNLSTGVNTTIAAAGGVTLNGGGVVLSPGSSVTVVKIATDAWMVQGQGAPGMILVSSSTFSAASTVSVNNCFTSTYTNYRIVIDASGSTDGSGAVATRARLRVGGSDNSTNYRESHIFNTQAGGPSRAYATGATSMLWGWIFDGNGGQIIVDLSRPATNDKTTGLTFSQSFGSAGAVYGVGGVSHDTGSAFDGFSFFPASGTLTGSVRIYGYRNS